MTRVERKLFLHAESDKAVLLSPTTIYADADRLGDWFPKSQIEVTATDTRRGGRQFVTVLIPEWLLKQKREMPDAEPGLPFGHDVHAQEQGG